MAQWQNTAEGGTDGVGVTTANSGGASGDAWDFVTTLSVPQYEADAAAAGSLGYVITTDQVGTQSQYVSWTSANSAALSVQFFVKFPQFPASADQRLVSIRNANTIGGLLILSTGVMRVMENTSGYTLSDSPALSTNTWYLVNLVIRQSGTTADYDFEIYEDDLSTLHHSYYGGHAYTPTNTNNLTTFQIGRTLGNGDFNGLLYLDHLTVAEQTTLLDPPSLANFLTITAEYNLIG